MTFNELEDILFQSNITTPDDYKDVINSLHSEDIESIANNIADNIMADIESLPSDARDDVMSMVGDAIKDIDAVPDVDANGITDATDAVDATGDNNSDINSVVENLIGGDDDLRIKAEEFMDGKPDSIKEWSLEEGREFLDIFPGKLDEGDKKEFGEKFMELREERIEEAKDAIRDEIASLGSELSNIDKANVADMEIRSEFYETIITLGEEYLNPEERAQYDESMSRTAERGSQKAEIEEKIEKLENALGGTNDKILEAAEGLKTQEAVIDKTSPPMDKIDVNPSEGKVDVNDSNTLADIEAKWNSPGSDNVEQYSGIARFTSNPDEQLQDAASKKGFDIKIQSTGQHEKRFDETVNSQKGYLTPAIKDVEYRGDNYQVDPFGKVIAKDNPDSNINTFGSLERDGKRIEHTLEEIAENRGISVDQLKAEITESSLNEYADRVESKLGEYVDKLRGDVETAKVELDTLKAEYNSIDTGLNNDRKQELDSAIGKAESYINQAESTIEKHEQTLDKLSSETDPLVRHETALGVENEATGRNLEIFERLPDEKDRNETIGPDSYEAAKEKYESIKDSYLFRNMLTTCSRLTFNVEAFNAGLPGANGKLVSPGDIAMDCINLLRGNIFDTILEIALRGVVDMIFTKKEDVKQDVEKSAANPDQVSAVSEKSDIEQPIDPIEVAASPNDTETKPDEIEVEPNDVETETLPDDTDVEAEPDNTELEPNDVEAESDDLEAEPDEVEVEPDDTEVEPDNLEAELDNIEAEPEEVEADLDDIEAEPSDTELEPDDIEIEPDDTEAEPDDTEVSPDDLEAEPDDTEAEPDDLETEPNNIEADPNDLEAEPDEVEVEPDDIEVEPDNLEAEPDGVEAEPEEVEADPDDIEADPSDTELEPDDIESEPDDIEAEPNDAELEPDDIEIEPDDTEAEPDDTEVSPDDLEAEPDDTEAEPDDLETEPNDIEADPNDLEAEPDEVEVEPDGTELEPDDLETEPDGAEAEPDDVEAEPEEVEADPDDIEADPGDTELEPDDIEMEPDDVETEPEEVEIEPDDIETEPDDVEAEPGGTETEPEDMEAEPDDTEASPDDLEAEPNGIEAEPDDIEAKPDDVETEPGDIEVDPDDTELEPDNIEAEPNNTDVEPDDSDNVEADPDNTETEPSNTDQPETQDIIGGTESDTKNSPQEDVTDSPIDTDEANDGSIDSNLTNKASISENDEIDFKGAVEGQTALNQKIEESAAKKEPEGNTEPSNMEQVDIPDNAIMGPSDSELYNKTLDACNEAVNNIYFSFKEDFLNSLNGAELDELSSGDTLYNAFAELYTETSNVDQTPGSSFGELMHDIADFHNGPVLDNVENTLDALRDSGVDNMEIEMFLNTGAADDVVAGLREELNMYRDGFEAVSMRIGNDVFHFDANGIENLMTGETVSPESVVESFADYIGNAVGFDGWADTAMQFSAGIENGTITGNVQDGALDFLSGYIDDMTGVAAGTLRDMSAYVDNGAAPMEYGTNQFDFTPDDINLVEVGSWAQNDFDNASNLDVINDFGRDVEPFGSADAVGTADTLDEAALFM